MNPKVVAMVQSGKVTWDLCDFAAYRADPLGLGGYLEELDYGVIDASRVNPNFVSKWGIASAVAVTTDDVACGSDEEHVMTVASDLREARLGAPV